MMRLAISIAALLLLNASAVAQESYPEESQAVEASENESSPESQELSEPEVELDQQQSQYSVPTHNRFTNGHLSLGLSLSGGIVKLSKTRNVSDYGLLELRAGYRIFPRIVTSVTMSIRGSGGDTKVQQGLVGIATKYWVRPQLWLSLGAELGLSQVDDSDSLGILMGNGKLGYDVFVYDALSISLELRGDLGLTKATTLFSITGGIGMEWSFGRRAQ